MTSLGIRMVCSWQTCGLWGIHELDAGQFYDLIHLLSLTGSPSEKHALVFNGDFVDRGSWSVEVALTLFAYKCWCLFAESALY